MEADRACLRRPMPPPRSGVYAVVNVMSHVTGFTTTVVGIPNMLPYAIVFFIIALLAALFGFGGIAAGAAGIAKVLFVLFIVLALASFVIGLWRHRGS